MPTSGVVAWSLTAQDLIVTALRRTGIVSIGETPDADELAECLVVLNGLLKSWTPGQYLQTTATVTAPAGDPSGSLIQEVGEILSVRLYQSATYERPLTRWERSEYLEIPNKGQLGDPVAYYAATQLDSVAIYLWPIPSPTDATLKVEYNRVVETVTALSQTVDFPEKYNELLYVELALNCAPMFGKEVSPQLIERGAYLRRMFEDDERPESYLIETDLN
jgi:hypothetical protein